MHTFLRIISLHIMVWLIIIHLLTILMHIGHIFIIIGIILNRVFVYLLITIMATMVTTGHVFMIVILIIHVSRVS